MSAKSRGKNVRVKSFKLGWLSQTIGDVRNDKWLTPCKNDSTRGVCLVCKDSSGKIGKSFSILEGFSAIRNHAKGKGHIDNFISHQNRIQDNENNDALLRWNKYQWKKPWLIKINAMQKKID